MSQTDEFLSSVASGKSDHVRALLDRTPGLVNSRNEQGVPALMLALYHGKQEVVELLLQYEPTVDVFEAAALGDTRKLKAGLHGNRTFVDAYSSDGWTPVHLAAFFGRPAALDYLLSLEPNLESVSKNETGVTPLQSALAAGEIELARKIIEAGADPNATANADHRALFYATQRNDAEMARMLLDHGADPNFPNASGRTPLDIAEVKGYKELAELFKTHGARR